MAQKSYFICPKCGEKMACDKRATGKAAKRHGGGFEHRVARELSKLTGLRWKKTPASGGMHLSGDIFCLDYMKMPFVIECKNDERITIDRIFRDPDFLLTADGGDPLMAPDKVGVINNHGQTLVILHCELYSEGNITPTATALSHGKMITIVDIDGESYFIGGLTLLLPAIRNHYKEEHRDGHGE